MLARGAKINASNRAGRTPLMEAIIRSPGVTDFRSETAMVKALLDAGANPDLFDSEGETAAHHAAIVGDPTSMVKIVLAASHDPRTKDRQGLDPVLLAVEHKHPALARSLFAQGFAPVAAPPRDPTQTDKDATRIDDHARIDESAFELYGDWLGQQAKPAEAVEAYRFASTFIQPAIEENDRAAGAIRLKLADDEHQRRNDRAATFAANIAGAAIGVATGVNLVTLQNFKGTVEADREMLKSIADDDAALTLRRDELQKKLQPT